VPLLLFSTLRTIRRTIK